MKITLFVSIIFLMVACADPKGKEIVKIPEASGISYCAVSDTLIVVNDEGSYYEISRKGKILHKIKLGNYDLEGVVCEEDQLIFVREDKGLLIVDRKRGTKKKVILDTLYQGKKLSLFDKKEGIEGIAKAGNILYLSKQSKKKKGSFIAVVKLKPYPLRIVDLIEPQIADIAGLDYHDGHLYMLSDKKDLLIKYDLEKRKIVQKVKLAEGAWEGISFDRKGNVYFADDDGRVVKYKKKHLGL